MSADDLWEVLAFAAGTFTFADDEPYAGEKDVVVDVLPGIRILATPGHTAGHWSRLVDTRRGRVLLAGQALYSRDEWLGRPGREGRSRARDLTADDRSVERLKSHAAAEVRFAHDRRAWQAPAEEPRPPAPA